MHCTTGTKAVLPVLAVPAVANTLHHVKVRRSRLRSSPVLLARSSVPKQCSSHTLWAGSQQGLLTVLRIQSEQQTA